LVGCKNGNADRGELWVTPAVSYSASFPEYPDVFNAE
jgi:hypothetical protein